MTLAAAILSLLANAAMVFLYRPHMIERGIAEERLRWFKILTMGGAIELPSGATIHIEADCSGREL